MKKLLIALSLLLCTAVSALAQTTITLPIAANVVADIGNGPIKVRMVAGNASIFTAQGSGTGSTSGSSTALTLTTTPATPPIVGGLISGTGITSGTTVTAYNGTTGVTLSAAMTVPGGTTVSWGAACPSMPPSNVIQASAMADYFIMYTQARVCAVSPGGPVNTLLIEPIFYDQTTPGGGGVVNVDTFFGSGRPWCDPRAYGAKGDASTDDDTAFIACLSALSALAPVGGGEFRISTGHYCLQSGAFSAALAASTVAVAFTGPGRLVTNIQGISWLDTCGADVDLIHLSASDSAVRGLRLTGAPFTTNPAHNALTITNGSAIAESLIEGGYYAVTTAPGVADWTLIDNNIRNSYGPAVIEVGSAGGYLIRNKVDGANTANSAPTAWSASTSVTAGQSVTTLGPNGVSYIIHYTVSGTSGGTAPVIAKYGTTFTDGTASAQLAVPVGAYALEVNSTLVIADQDDFSGNYAYGVHVTGVGAQFISTAGDATANLNGSILVDNGYASILNGILGSCVASPCKAVNATTSAAGVTVGSGTVIGGATTGIEYDAGTALQVTGVRFYGLTNGINVGTANLSNISIVGNIFGFQSSAVTNGIVFANGASDYVSILGNTYQNTTTPFTGTITGSHNRNETLGVSCSGSPTSGFVSNNGIVTHC